MTIEAIPSVRVDDREILLLGTAHVSAESVQQVEAAIRETAPDCVCVELDEKRLKALSDPDAWKRLDLFTVIRQGQFSTLIANILLSSHQKRMGLQTGVKPGAELHKAVTTAQELGIPVVLVDREIKTTLRRVWSLTPWWRRFKLAGGLLESIFETEKVTEEDLGNLREQDTLSSMMDEMGKEFPEVRQVMLDERDHFMVGRIRQAPGKR
ncbi:MAG TPA: TraB domain-containing protein, partial [Fibrobacteria bacterium]|nr:TraB domain-containing protein [Fibrobacteria bacterium]